MSDSQAELADARRWRPAAGWAAALLVVVVLAAWTPAAAQGGAGFGQSASLPPDEPEGEKAPSVDGASFDDPYAAYEAGAFDRALQGFVDQQVEMPEEPAVWLSIGSAHYKLGDYPEAEKALAAAALVGDDGIRAEALYNLGNCAYRQGRLEEAVVRYRAVLEIDPDDEDAKFNLEFVRDEIRRRVEEAQKRQKEGQQPPQGEEEQQQEQPAEEGQQGQQETPQPEVQDRDGDGLPDDTERGGENPTDPENPDTDGDGLLDGQEDANRNGRVDEGETDPNRFDSDGDGKSDGEEAAEEQAAAQAAGEARPESQEGLSPEEAERYLQALDEDRPPPSHPTRRGRPARPEKDW